MRLTHILWTPFFLEIVFRAQRSLVSFVKDVFLLVLKGLSSFESVVGNGGPKGDLWGH